MPGILGMLVSKADDPALIEVFGVFFDPLGFALIVLGLAFIIEGYSFIVALKEFLLAMRRDGAASPIGYLLESKDPTLIAVVLEDSVAMLGLVFAIAGIGLSAITGNVLWDVGFSCADCHHAWLHCFLSWNGQHALSR